MVNWPNAAGSTRKRISNCQLGLETESWVICHIGGVVRMEANQELSEDRMRHQAKLTQGWETFFPQTHSTDRKSIFFNNKKIQSRRFPLHWVFLNAHFPKTTLIAFLKN